MKPRRALLFTITFVLALCAACGVWLHRERQQYALNRQLIDALNQDDTKQALVLVNAGADPNTREGPTPAPTLPQLLKHLLHHTPPLTNDSSPALAMACYRNRNRRKDGSEPAVSAEARLALFRALISHGANINARAGDTETALIYAVVFQNSPIVELLLGHGADPNIPDDAGNAPLILAIGENSTQKVRLLLAYGANPNMQDRNGNAPLHDTLIASLNKTILQQLLAHGADPNRPNKQGTTPLQLAQQAKRPDLVRLLKGGTK